MSNTELNDEIKISCLKKSQGFVETEKFSLKCHWKICRAWHIQILSAILQYQSRYRSVTITTKELPSVASKFSILAEWCLDKVNLLSILQTNCRGNNLWRHWYRSMAASICHVPPIFFNRNINLSVGATQLSPFSHFSLLGQLLREWDLLPREQILFFKDWPHYGRDILSWKTNMKLWKLFFKDWPHFGRDILSWKTIRKLWKLSPKVKLVENHE